MVYSVYAALQGFAPLPQKVLEMSNLWSYNLLLPPGVRLTQETIMGIIARAQRIGFMAHNPVSRKVLVMSLDGLSDFDYEDLADAAAFLEAERGRIQLWKGGVDVGLIFEIRKGNGLYGVEQLENSEPIVGISIDGTNYRGENKQRGITAHSIFQLFVTLSTGTRAKYGYSWDEEFYDLAYLRGEVEVFERLYSDVRQGQPPSTLFWLNYFSSDYAETIELDSIKRLGATITIVPGGSLVTFFDYPWNVNASTLWEINQHWREKIEMMS